MSTTLQHLSADLLSKGIQITVNDVYNHLRHFIAQDLAYKVLSRLQLVIFTQVAHKEPVLINAEDYITTREVRSIWSKESRTLESNTTAPVCMARKLSAQNVVQICRSVDIKNFIISRSHSISPVEFFDVAVNFSVCLFQRVNAIFEKPDRKLALHGAPHTLNAALCLRRPRQDLMDVELFANALPLGALFMHDLELFPGGQVFTMRSMTEDSSTIGVNLPRHAVGIAGLTQDLQVAIKAFKLGKIEPGYFPGGVVNPARQTIAFLITELIEPGKRSTVHLHKVALTIPPQTRTVYRLFLFHAVRLRRDQTVLFHNFTHRRKRDFNALELLQAPAEIRKVDVGIMAGVKQDNPLGQSWINLVFRNAATVPVFEQRIPQKRVLLLEDTQMLPSIAGRLCSLPERILAIIKTFDVHR